MLHLIQANSYFIPYFIHWICDHITNSSDCSLLDNKNCLLLDIFFKKRIIYHKISMRFPREKLIMQLMVIVTY